MTGPRAPLARRVASARGNDLPPTSSAPAGRLFGFAMPRPDALVGGASKRRRRGGVEPSQLGAPPNTTGVAATDCHVPAADVTVEVPSTGGDTQFIKYMAYADLPADVKALIDD